MKNGEERERELTVAVQRVDDAHAEIGYEATHAGSYTHGGQETSEEEDGTGGRPRLGRRSECEEVEEEEESEGGVGG